MTTQAMKHTRRNLEKTVFELAELKGDVVDVHCLNKLSNWDLLLKLNSYLIHFKCEPLTNEEMNEFLYFNQKH